MKGLTAQQKTAFCLEVIENLKGQISDGLAADYIGRAVTLIQRWMHDQTDISQELYDLLDDEPYSLTVFQEAETDERLIAVWSCIIDAAAYICRAVYDAQGAKYYPEPIELVDEDTFARLVQAYQPYRSGQKSI